jgi:3',5'-cyclic AMP phosphodiesterase CpdA
LRSRSIKKAISEVNLLHPDFVIISGDLTFGQWYPFEYNVEYKKCYELLQMFDVPTYLAPGNHDGYKRMREDGLEYWQEYFGPLYYSFDYGNYHFLSINSYDWPAKYRTRIGPITLTWGGYIEDEQLDWIEQDLENNTYAEKTFMFLHHNPLWDTIKDTLIRKEYKNREELLSLIDDYNVEMVLAGHTHIDNVTIRENTTYIVTTTPESEIRDPDGVWGYRQIKIVEGEVASYNYKEPRFSIPSYKINVEHVDQYTTIIENDLEMDITILLKFTVPKRAYIIQNGIATQTREDNLQRTYYIQSDIEKESEKEIKLSFIS